MGNHLLEQQDIVHWGPNVCLGAHDALSPMNDGSPLDVAYVRLEERERRGIALEGFAVFNQRAVFFSIHHCPVAILVFAESRLTLRIILILRLCIDNINAAWI